MDGHGYKYVITPTGASAGDDPDPTRPAVEYDVHTGPQRLHAEIYELRMHVVNLAATIQELNRRIAILERHMRINEQPPTGEQPNHPQVISQWTKDHILVAAHPRATTI